MSLATDRVREFLNARAYVSSVAPERIAVVFAGGETHELTVSDLWELVGDSVRLEELRGGDE